MPTPGDQKKEAAPYRETAAAAAKIVPGRAYPSAKKATPSAKGRPCRPIAAIQEEEEDEYEEEEEGDTAPAGSAGPRGEGGGGLPSEVSSGIGSLRALLGESMGALNMAELESDGGDFATLQALQHC